MSRQIRVGWSCTAAFAGAVVMVFLGQAGVRSGAKTPMAKPHEIPLPQQPTEWTDQTAVYSVAGLTVDDGRIFLLEKDRRQIVEMPFFPDQPSREKRFGKMADAIRHPMPGMEGGGIPRALAVSGNVMLVLDGERLGVQEIEMVKDPKKPWRERSMRAIPWDLVRPPRDRGGEATTGEIAATRSRLKRAFAATQGARFIGMKEVPKDWGQDGAERVYVVTSRMPGFPLFLMGCMKSQTGEKNQCVLHRTCPVQGLSDADVRRGFAGVAVSAKRREIYLAHAVEPVIFRVKYGSCQSIEVTGEFLLPARMRPVRALHVDDQDRLLVGTDAPDDFESANLYVWPPDRW